MATNHLKILYKDYEELLLKNDVLTEENQYLKYEHNLLVKQLETLRKKEKELENQISLIKEKDKEIAQLQKELTRLKAIANNDGTNSSIPTSMTPIYKNKIIPNSRVKTGKSIGGQIGHKKHKLERFEDDEVTKVIVHPIQQCSKCKSQELKQIDTIYKDELDYKIVVVKNRHEFGVYECLCCGKKIRSEIPSNLKMENQYGPQVQAFALSLMNQGNVPINKVRKIITGFTDRELNLSEGFIAKLQNKASRNLESFNEELRLEMLKQRIVYWDDTVIMINKNRACLRYYGTELLALYKAHLHKDKEGIDNDNILTLLPKETTVVHDHNKVNYNKDYSYSRSECNEHLLRDLKKVSDNLLHKWSEDLRKLLSKTNNYRNELIKRDKTSFAVDELKDFFDEFDDIMISSFKENREDNHKYYSSEEKTLITRILDYKNEYLAWVLDFELPFTNNLSERSLRGIKTKMKVSGQFQNEKTASYYASIKSYIETCYRNGVSEFNALLLLCLDKPLSLKDILNQEQ